MSFIQKNISTILNHIVFEIPSIFSSFLNLGYKDQRSFLLNSKYNSQTVILAKNISHFLHPRNSLIADSAFISLCLSDVIVLISSSTLLKGQCVSKY